MSALQLLAGFLIRIEQGPTWPRAHKSVRAGQASPINIGAAVDRVWSVSRTLLHNMKRSNLYHVKSRKCLSVFVSIGISYVQFSEGLA